MAKLYCRLFDNFIIYAKTPLFLTLAWTIVSTIYSKSYSNFVIFVVY